MTKPTKEQIDGATGEQLSDWVAVWCMGWTHIDESPLQNFYEFVGPSTTRNPEFFNDYFRVKYEDWQPHLPTERGKAQAIDLAEKYNLQLDMYLDRVAYVDNLYHQTVWISFFDDKNWQKANMKACLYSVIGKE